MIFIPRDSVCLCRTYFYFIFVLLCECLRDFYQQEQLSWWLTTYSRYLLLIKVAFKGIHKNGNQISRFLRFFFLMYKYED